MGTSRAPRSLVPVLAALALAGLVQPSAAWAQTADSILANNDVAGLVAAALSAVSERR